MLSIAKLSAGQEDYFLEAEHERIDVADGLADGPQDYYVDPHEAPGRWAGAGAARLALAGGVEPHRLRRLFAGAHPTAEIALRATARARVAAFDLTFSAPKSVSVLFGLGGDAVQSAVRLAHDRAVGQAVVYLERNAAAVRRGHGGAVVLPADGLVAAVFRHRTSRAGDPQLHSHVVIANVGYGADGRWTALDGRRLYRHAATASRIYQAVLRAEASRALGVEWEPVRDGIAELAGVPADVRRLFSRRRAEIEAALAERGVSGPRAAEVAALGTRRAKRRSGERRGLSADWRRRAAELGWLMTDLDRVIGRTKRPPSIDADVERLLGELLGPDGLTRGRSTFARHDVIAALCEWLPVGMGLDAALLESLADRVLASPAVVALVGEDGQAPVATGWRRRDGRTVPVAQAERRYSTVELLATERRVLDSAERVRSRSGGVPAAVVDRVLARRSALTGEQARMVRRITEGEEAVVVVCGRAGTGKTFGLAAAREVWEAAGSTVVGAAVARRAARELEIGAGIASTSVHALLGRLDGGRRLPGCCVVVLDEAGMLGTRQLARVLDHVTSAGGRLVLVGDHRQLPELEAGGTFRALARRPGAIRLEENRRQVDGWERDALDHLREGRAEAALDLYAGHGRLRCAPTGAEACAALVDDWWAAYDPDSSLIIAGTRRDVAELNRLARRRMAAAGQLGPDELRLHGQGFAIGDRVVIRRNDLATGVCNGDRGRVLGVEPTRWRMVVAVPGREGPIDLDARFLLRRTERGDPPLAQGYAVTCHVAQGMTLDRTFVLAGRGISREWAYAALSRGRAENRLYFASGIERGRDELAPAERPEHSPDARVRLARDMARSDAQPLALDRLGRARGIER